MIPMGITTENMRMYNIISKETTMKEYQDSG